MARLPYVGGTESDNIAREIRARRKGALRPLDQILLNSPNIALGWNSFLGSVREGTELTALERETLILRVAVLTDSQYEWDAHAKVALEAGATGELLEEIRSANGALQDPKLDQLMKTAEEITRSTTVSDKTFEALRATYSEKQILEIVVTAATYNMVSRVINSLHIGEGE